MKFLKMAALFLLCLCLLSGCSQSEELTVDVIADELRGFAVDGKSWVEMDSSKMSTYFEINSETVTDYKAYINSSEEHFDMIAVFEYEGEEIAKDILSGIDSMSGRMSANYLLASADEAEKIDDRIVAQSGRFIILCIMDNSSEVNKYITEDVKAKIIS